MQPWAAFVAGLVAGALVFALAVALERALGVDDPGDSIVRTLATAHVSHSALHAHRHRN